MNSDPIVTPPERRKLQTHEYIVSGLPMILMAVGGALGGAIGGGAFALNISIFRSERSPATKYILSVLVAAAACLVYLGAVIILALIFPGLFRKR
jgi:hypothetical protein